MARREGEVTRGEMKRKKGDESGCILPFQGPRMSLVLPAPD